MSKIIKCHRCDNDFAYDEAEDKDYNDIIPMNGRKVVVDENDNSFPFYAIPPDKRRMIDDKFIKMECNKCIKPVE